jgi:hypothetical protein
LSIQLRFVLPSGLFPSGFPTNSLYAFLVSPFRATIPVYLIMIDLIIIIMFFEEYKLWRYSCSFLQSLFGPNILLSTPFANTLSLCSSLNVRDQVPHQYRTTSKIIILYILIFMFLDSRRVHKNSSHVNIRVVKSSRLQWAGHVERTEETYMHTSYVG